MAQRFKYKYGVQVNLSPLGGVGGDPSIFRLEVRVRLWSPTTDVSLSSNLFTTFTLSTVSKYRQISGLGPTLAAGSLSLPFLAVPAASPRMGLVLGGLLLAPLDVCWLGGTRPLKLECPELPSNETEPLTFWPVREL